MRSASGPDTRTMPTPPPAAVAIAAMVFPAALIGAAGYSSLGCFGPFDASRGKMTR